MGQSASKANPFLYYNHMKEDPPSSGKGSTCLLLIDPQNDFVLETGSLSVPGAIADCDRIRGALAANIAKVNDIFVTMDTHEKYHIAHAVFWRNASGERPKAFSLISVEDVQNKTWYANNPIHQAWAESYVKALRKGGRFKLTIWPEHCLIGSPGHAIYEPLMHTIHEWEEHHMCAVNVILKGNNAFTEHYSALKAEVPMKDDPRTLMNENLIRKLNTYDHIVIGGEALSHCLNFTVRDLIDALPRSALRKIRIISDGSSNVPGFESAGSDFVKEMKARGVKFVPAAEVFN